VEFRILGPLEVIDGKRPVLLPQGRARALLALLVLHAGQVVSADRLIDELWGEESPPTAATALQGLVSALRRRLEPTRRHGQSATVLQTRAPGYILVVDAGDVDASRFKALVDDAHGAAALEKAAKLQEALTLWRGQALVDFTYQPFAQPHIAALDELHLATVEERIDADLALGRHGDVVGELPGLVAEHPVRERLRGQLMLALYRSGRQVEALEVYRVGRRQLVDELGIEPGHALQWLEQAILRQDVALDVTTTTRPDVASTAAEPWLPRGRKGITLLLLGLAPPTGIDQRLDPEALALILGRFEETAASVITRHRGTVETFIGDAVLGVFGVPKAHEDDALRALRAAVELQQALVTMNDELDRDHGFRLAIRTAINTGDAIVDAAGIAQKVASGEGVRVAARLERAAADGEVLVGESTRRLVRHVALLDPVESLMTEDDTRPVSAWRLLGLLPDASAFAWRLDAGMVGRAAELARLQAVFERTSGRRTAYRLTVFGEAGIGKSRLATEFAEAIGSSALVLTGHCPAYGEGITFWPLREIVLQATGPGGVEALAELLRTEDDGTWIAGQVAGAVGLTQELGRPDELFPAIRRFFEALADRRPLVIIIEDAHWAEPTLLDLIEYLSDRSRAPVLLLCLARPELLESRPGWGAGRRTADTMFLEPLSASDTETLIADRLAGAPMPPGTLARVAQTAGGNPLFAEQMVAAFEDEGFASVPASIDALLSARLDRLGPAERDVLRSAAVIGTDFSVDALMALVPDQARPFVERHLQSLQQKRLIRPARSARRALRFRHVLVQLAAYRSMTREDRARLHQRYAEWLESEATERPPELDEILGYHLEEAVAQRRAIGMPAEHDRALAVRAGEHLANAGQRAARRRDMTAAENLLSRAKALLAPGHPQRREVMRLLGDAYPPLGRHAEADAVLAEMLDEVLAAGDRQQEQVIRLKRARIRLDTGRDPTDVYTIREEAERALDEFSATEDHAGVAQAAYLLAQVYRLMGATREMKAVAHLGLAHAHLPGLLREEPALRFAAAWATQAGEMPVQEAIRVCESLAGRGATLHPPVLLEVATLHAMIGEFDEARELIARARRLLQERERVRRPLMFVAHSSGAVEILAGDLASAEGELRAALQMALDMGERDELSQVAAILSLIQTGKGDFDEAGRLAALSAHHASAEGVARAICTAAKAGVSRGRGQIPEAQRLAKEAVRLSPTGMPNLRADLLVAWAEALRAGGHENAARPAIGEAIELYERKGNLVSAARARSVAAAI
jgi:DNA-binding SARP family transcriptional activator/tetratricopeptide (TPR) repeat protein